MKERIQDNLIVINVALIGALLVFVVMLMGGARTSNASIEDVAQKVTDVLDLTGMSSSDTRTLRRFYGLNPADYEGVVLYTGNSNMEAQELLIIKMGDRGQASAVSEAMQQRVERQLQSFEGYGAEQTKLLQDSIIDVQGNYAMLAVNALADKADQAFRDSL